MGTKDFTHLSNSLHYACFWISTNFTVKKKKIQYDLDQEIFTLQENQWFFKTCFRHESKIVYLQSLNIPPIVFIFVHKSTEYWQNH